MLAKISRNFPATISILALCVTIQIAQMYCPAIQNYTSMNYKDLHQLSTLWRALLGLFTYQFGHAGWGHLLGNFEFMLPYAAYLEYRIGSKQFLMFYLVCGVAAAATFFCIAPNAGIIGSSGAAFGVVIGALLYFGETVPEKMVRWGLIMLFVVPQVISALMALMAPAQIAFVAHLGGGYAGYILSRHVRSIR